MKKIDLFIFDLDGTLIDSKRDIANSVHHTLRSLGLPDIENDVIYSYVGNGVTPLIQKSVETAEGKAGELDFFEALTVFRKHYEEHCLDTTETFPGIREVLKHFSDRPKIVLTNKSQNFSEKIIQGLGLKDTFRAVYGGDTQFPKKPDPTVVKNLLKEFGTARNKAVIIGDSRVDIETGKNAKILTCGVAYGFRPRQELVESRCDDLIEAPQDLLKIYS